MSEQKANDKTLVKQICDGLKRWYEHCENDEYEALFSNFCEESGIDDSGIRDDLIETDMEEVTILDFIQDLDEFPYDNGDGSGDPEDETARKQFIFKLITRLSKEPDLIFGACPQFDKTMLSKLSKGDIEKTCKLYGRQIPQLWSQGMDKDEDMIQVLSIGHRHRLDYMLHLADDYAQWRARELAKGKRKVHEMDESHWVHGHKHFETLKNVKRRKGRGYDEMSKMAVQSFYKRIMPKVMFTPGTKINSSLKATVMYMVGATTFVQNLLTRSKDYISGICPFQFDVAIAVGKPQPNLDDNIGDDDDEDDDEDDGKDGGGDGDVYYDYIGDIEGKLKKNELKFWNQDSNPETDARRIWGELFQKFLEHNKLQDAESETSYLQKKRIISMIDRRKYDQSGKVPADQVQDKVFMYEPPDDARDIPNDAVPEWSIAASRRCTLPHMSYADGDIMKEMAEESEALKDLNDAQKREYWAKNKNIGAAFGCSGAMLTLSFHVKQEKVIKLYLFCNGQCMRFMPEDIKTVLPALFNMEFGDNKEWIEREEEVEEHIEQMKRVLIDEEFEAFQQSYL